MTADEPAFRWRSIALPALLPTLVFAIGEGAILPVIPLVADDLGATLAIAGLVAAALTVGELLGTLPSGPLISRIGERWAMIGASGLSILGLLVCLIAASPWILGLGVLLIGLATAVFSLARHAFMTSFVPMRYRARALSTLGGTFRLGFFIGPFLTAGLIQVLGAASWAFWIHIVACVATVVILLTLRDPASSFGTVRRVPASGAPPRAGLFRTIRDRRDVLARMGLGAALVSALRASRQVILPLWAVSIGLDPAATALVIGVAAGLDFALFYTGGAIMDRFGRLWTAVPAMVGLGAGHLVLALTHDLSASATWFTAAAMLLAVANGIGSGILMTLSADLADPTDPAPFLGAWRFIGGLGTAGAPLLISAITGLASLAIAAGTMGALGWLGALVLARYVPRYAPRKPPPAR